MKETYIIFGILENVFFDVIVTVLFLSFLSRAAKKREGPFFSLPQFSFKCSLGFNR